MSRQRREKMKVPNDRTILCGDCLQYGREFFTSHPNLMWCGFFKKNVDRRANCETFGDYQEEN